MTPISEAFEVTSVLPIWNIQTALASPCALEHEPSMQELGRAREAVHSGSQHVSPPRSGARERCLADLSCQEVVGRGEQSLCVLHHEVIQVDQPPTVGGVPPSELDGEKPKFPLMTVKPVLVINFLSTKNRERLGEA